MNKKMNGSFKLIVLVAIILISERCLPEETKYFHSKANGYSFAIPRGWIQVPDDVLYQSLHVLLSGQMKQSMLKQYEVAFQLNADRWLKYPYVFIQAIKYSEEGLRNQPDEDDFEYLAETITGFDFTSFDTDKHLSKNISGQVTGPTYVRASIDKHNHSYVLEAEMGVSNLGDVKAQTIGYFGKYALVQLIFYDLRSDWDQSKDYRELLFKSFQFDPDKAYGIADAGPGFWEKRAMEALPVIVLMFIIISISAVSGYISGIIKRYKDKKVTEQPKLQKEMQLSERSER